MTAFEWFAAAGMPAIIVVLGYALLKWSQWDLRKHDPRQQEKLHPGE
jgi:hypothetical protein